MIQGNVDDFTMRVHPLRQPRFRPSARRPVVIGIALLSLLLQSPFSAVAAPEPPADLTAGLAALEDGLFDLAEGQFRRLLKDEDDSQRKAALTVYLGQALYGKGQVAELVELFEKSRKSILRSDAADGFSFWLATAHYRLDNPKAAIDILQGFDDAYPPSRYRPQAAQLLIRAYRAAGLDDLAFAEHSRYAERYADSAAAAANLLDWAKALVEAGKGDAALSVLERLAVGYVDDPLAVEARYWQGQIHLDQEQWAAASAALGPLTNSIGVSSSTLARAWFALATVAEVESNLTQAVEFVRRGIAAAPDPAPRIEGEFLLGRLLLRQGDLDAAIERLKGCIVEAPGHAMAGGAQLEVAQAVLDRGDNDRAIDEFQQYLEAFTNRPGVVQALSGKGWALLRLKRFTEAADAFARAAESAADPLVACQAGIKAADAHFAAGQFQHALTGYEAAAKHALTNFLPQILYQMGECQIRLGHDAEAQVVFQSLATNFPNHSLAERGDLRLGRLDAEKGDHEQAAAHFDAFLASRTNSPLVPLALQQAADIAYRTGRYADALADFELLVKDFPDTDYAEYAFFMRGYSHYMLQRPDKAASICRDFIEKYPKSRYASDVLFWLAVYDYNHRAFQTAEEQFVELSRAHPKHPLADDAVFWAGRAAFMQEQFTRAVAHFSLLAKEMPDSPKLVKARYYQGLALKELGEFDAAIVVFDQVIKKHGRSYLVDAALGQKGDCQFQLGEQDKGRYAEAMISYGVVAKSDTADRCLALEAEYKIGRCLEKTQGPQAMFDHLVTQVVYPYLADRGAGVRHGPHCATWFTRSAFEAATLKVKEEKWREAITLYKRVVEADVPAAKDAQDQINRIRLKHWMIF